MKRGTLIKKSNKQESERTQKRSLHCEVQMEVHGTAEMGNYLLVANRVTEGVD